MAERAPSLPPLAALRAFDAAARHLSFTRAAEELFVTQTAVSHQIRILEDWIGFPLFKRINNRLTLTERGDIYLKAVHEGFNRIRNSTAALRSNEVGTILTISALPNFALNWLVPRLPDFAGKYPHIEVRLFMHRHSLDLLHDGIDVAIRERSAAHSLQVDHLFDTDSFPVASPKLLERIPLAEPGDLANHTLLHNLTSLDDWKGWATAAGLRGVDIERGPKFDSYALSTAAAVAGWGVAIARMPFVLHALRDGSLVMPFKIRARNERGWCLVHAGGDAARKEKVECFREWILDQAKVTREEAAWPFET